MLTELFSDRQFQKLAREYKFLNRARGQALDELEAIVLDIETTGLDPIYSEIIEIGAFKVKGSEVKDIFSSLIRPSHNITAEITRLTGIDNEMVKDFPPIETVLQKFVEFAKDSLLVAHNSEFDIPFIKHHLKKCLDQELTNPIACTLKLSRHLLPNLANHKLHTVASYFKLPIANRHRSIGDVELTFAIWDHFTKMLQQKNIMTQADLISLIAKLSS